MSSKLKTFIGIICCIQMNIFAQSLSLKDYLLQVQGANLNFQAAKDSQIAALQKTEESELPFTVQAFADYTLTNDSKLQQILFIQYDSILTNYFSIGLKKLTPFGLSASLSFNMTQTSYIHPKIASPAFSSMANSGTIFLTTSNAGPSLEIKQNLWSNGFGRASRAQKQQIFSTALANAYEARLSKKQLLLEAELSYFTLTTCLQILSIQKEALQRAEQILKWVQSKRHLYLKEDADEAQAMALVRLKRLELESAEIEAKKARFDFNVRRMISSDIVLDELVYFDDEEILKLEGVHKQQPSDQLKALAERVKAKDASVLIQQENLLPTLDLVGSISSNGQKKDGFYGSMTDSVGPSFQFKRLTQTVGVHFSVPLDFSLLNKLKQTYRVEAISAQHQYEQKLFEEQDRWKRLIEEMQDAQRRFQLLKKLQEAQKHKLSIEEARLQRGRSTTYQILLFQQDYLNAQLSKIREQANIFSLHAQMKLFGEDYESSQPLD